MYHLINVVSFKVCFLGMVNFFSIVNDVERNVKVLYDKALYEAPW